MSGSFHPTESDSNFPTEVDPRRLTELVEQAVSLKESGDASFVNTVLSQLNASERETYVQPLLERLEQYGSQSLQFGDGNATIEPQNGITAPPPPLPTADERRPKAKKQSKKAEPEPEPVPESIGKFRIERELGRGACGAVYLGYDDELERHVAVKVSHVTDKHQMELLRIEASKLAKIDSPGIVPVYHIGRTEYGEVFIVEKYIQGLTLRDFIKPGPLSPATTAMLMREIALGLEPAHLCEILHRDLKPENVLIEKSNGRPWIADFGLAISEDEQAGHRRQLAGTPPYMAPEQIKGKVDFLDPRSDIWALGVMYYEMLTGKLPFNGTDRKSLTEQICNLDPRPLQQRAPGVLTEAMNDIFLRCCAKKPAERYASIRDLADDLDKLIAGRLSDRNIRGETMASRLGDMVTETARSTYMSTQRFSTTSASTRTDSHVGAPKRWLSVFALWVIGAVVVIGLSIAGSIAAIVHFRPDAEPRAELDGSPTPGVIAGDAGAKVDVANSDPDNAMGLDQADGSPHRPWVVAADGSGSHRTIAAAIESSQADAHIRVMAGIYEEALHVSVPITIEGPPPQMSDGVTSYVSELRSSTQTPVTIDCPGGKVMIRNFAIEGEGHHSTKEFNAIDVVGGTLVLDSCDLKTNSFNCVKVRTGSVLGARQCRFLKSREFAISAVAGTVVTDQCDFIYSGVQLVGGTGTIKDCKMFGSYGIYASDSSKRVEVIDCLLEDNLEYGIASTNGGDIWASGVTFRGSKTGIRVSVLNQENENNPPGKLTLTGGSTLEGCDTGVFVQGGIFSSDGNCRIERSDYGIWASEGTVTLNDLIVSQMENSGISVSDGAAVKLVDCMIDRCKETGIHVAKKSVLDLTDCTIEGCQTGIDLLAGEFTYIGGVVRDCDNAGILVGDKENWSRGTASGKIHDVAISGFKSAGMIAYSGPIRLSEMSFDGGQVGLYAWGPPSSELSRVPLVEVGLSGARFANQSQFRIVARGDARVTVDPDVFDALIHSRRAMMEPPAKIVEAEPDAKSDSPPVSDATSDR